MDTTIKIEPQEDNHMKITVTEDSKNSPMQQMFDKLDELEQRVAKLEK